MSPLSSWASDLAEGERRRDEALDRLRDCRPALVRRVQRSHLGVLLARGELTTDLVRDEVAIPEGIDPRLTGAAVRSLATLKLIRRVGHSRSRRPVAHGRDRPVWEIRDRPAVFEWLDSHPELPDPAPLDS